MKKADISTVPLAYREGLAIMNGSQFMTAIAALNIYDAERLIKQTEIVCSMTIDVLNCVESAYSKEYNEVRPFKGQNITASNIRALLSGSDLLKQPKNQSKMLILYDQCHKSLALSVMHWIIFGLLLR